MSTAQPLRFVVNRHRATSLHFDLRLEVGDVLASWAVPKGPSLDPAARRLAVQVDDHDLDQLTYEGASETDRGRVHSKIVWDAGTYEPAEPPGPALTRGHLRFVLTGHKLNGGFALTRTGMGGHARHWILIKIADDHAGPGPGPADDHRSVMTGLRNEDLEAAARPTEP